jgi:hypothetical protein
MGPWVRSVGPWVRKAVARLRILCNVTRSAASILIIVFLSLNVLDGVCCPDGCTDQQQSSAAPNPDRPNTGCLLCAGGVNSVAARSVLSPALIVVRAMSERPASPADIPAPPLEHPPRA